MLTNEGPKVIEYNSRFGDPEAQAVLPLLDSDLFTIFKACADGRLEQVNIKWKNSSAVCVVLASGGYPANYEKGYEITGLDTLKNKKDDDVRVFHAGTTFKDEKTLTNGGRVLGVTGIGENLQSAADKAYCAVKHVSFKDMCYRKDIGGKL
jgi:phosphoribosylamine--glycine ligase